MKTDKELMRERFSDRHPRWWEDLNHPDHVRLATLARGAWSPGGTGAAPAAGRAARRTPRRRRRSGRSNKYLDHAAMLLDLDSRDRVLTTAAERLMDLAREDAPPISAMRWGYL